jgi:hypothetical protein
VSIVVTQQCQRNLLEIVLAFYSPRRLARGLNRWQQQRDEDPDDRDDDQQLDERESFNA